MDQAHRVRAEAEGMEVDQVKVVLLDVEQAQSPAARRGNVKVSMLCILYILTYPIPKKNRKPKSKKGVLPKHLI